MEYSGRLRAAAQVCFIHATKLVCPTGAASIAEKIGKASRVSRALDTLPGFRTFASSSSSSSTSTNTAAAAAAAWSRSRLGLLRPVSSAIRPEVLQAKAPVFRAPLPLQRLFSTSARSQDECAPKIKGAAAAAGPGRKDDEEEEGGVEGRDKDVQSWKDVPEVKLKDLPGIYAQLAKLRLGGLVVLTTMAGYSLAPGALDMGTMASVSVGTALCVAAANTLNQWAEVPFDSQMKRTKTRPIVRGAISPTHALGFAAASALSGFTLLYTCVNPLVAALGVGNIVLYAFVYTPMKRASIANTWAGSIVGAIPPLMGWAASTGALEPGAWILASLLYAWQFPHFNALSWNLRGDYSKAGYRMMSVTDPALCRRVALRYTLLLTPICLAAPLLDVTTWTFAFDSTLFNLYFGYQGYRFYQNAEEKTARKLFLTSLWHLPVVMILLFAHKNRQAQLDEDKDKAAQRATVYDLIFGTQTLPQFIDIYRKQSTVALY